MFVRVCVILLFGFILEWNLTQSAPADLGKGKEKVRAYEFGYSIEENQHRHEKRDENGIVMGEFGFITADGIYHVTVYATDENGKFKILAMKSYPYRSPEKKIMAVTLPPVRMPVFTKATPSDTKSCGGCVLPKKTKPNAADVNVKKQLPADSSETLFRPLSKSISDNARPLAKGAPAIASKPPSGPSSQAQPNSIGQPTATATGGNGKTYPITTLQTAGPPQGGLGPASPNRMNKSFPIIGSRFGFEGQGGQTGTFPSSFAPQAATFPSPIATQTAAFPSSFGTQKATFPSSFGAPPATLTSSFATQKPLFTPQRPPTPQNTITQSTAKASPPSYKNPQPSQPPSLAPRISAFTPTQNTNRYTPGQVAPTQSNTPTGSQPQNTNAAKTQTTTTKLTPVPQSVGTKLTPSTSAAAAGGNGGGPLYRFNYVLDYNSHREEGRIDGSKEGNYKAIDEDGIRRIVDYIANENGFQPHIKWERVPMSELPTGDNKLKEYEFVWFNSS